jgi:hypothetical protein
LDSTSLTIHNYTTGRWLQRDPLGVNPAGGKDNLFKVLGQYKNGLNLYEYAGGAPVVLIEPYGLYSWTCKANTATKSLCQCLKPIPYFKAGARALEIGWCNGCAGSCTNYCFDVVGMADPDFDSCMKACEKEHAFCVLRGGVPRCDFRFKIKK